MHEVQNRGSTGPRPQLTPQHRHRHRVLLIGNHCVSKDVAARLRRAGCLLAKFETGAAGIEAAAAVQFDFAVIDADGLGHDDLASVREAFLQRGLKAIAVMRCDSPGPAGPDSCQPELLWRLLTKPVAFETLVGAFQSA